jgi:release factor glutamine methyltransferase
MPSIAEALALGRERLKACGIDTPGLDASLLLAELLDTTREKLLITEHEILEEGSFRRFLQYLDRRASGESIAWIRGRREFRGLDFLVGPDVLVPRPDTEILVEAALKKVKQLENPGGKSLKALDLCTGSGAVAVALKHEKPDLELWGSDISPKALDIARTNAERLLPENSIRFLMADLFALPSNTGPFSLIVSNPPYVASAEITGLSREVQREPRLALDGGNDGLDLIRRIINEAPDHLETGGYLLLEADPREMGEIARLLKNRGFGDISLEQDLAGLDRVVSASFGAGT